MRRLNQALKYSNAEVVFTKHEQPLVRECDRYVAPGCSHMENAAITALCFDVYEVLTSMVKVNYKVKIFEI